MITSASAPAPQARRTAKLVARALSADVARPYAMASTARCACTRAMPTS